MNIAIVGTGYVGLVSGTCFAEMGIDVTCVDVNEEKVRRLNDGETIIYEPGLDELIARNRKAGRLHFTSSLQNCLNSVSVVFCAVGTPPDEDGSADLRYVLEVAKEVGQNMNNYLVVVTKSTVPVGAAKKVKDTIKSELVKRGVDVEFDVASNPEFLKEGSAVTDFMKPDRVVIGVESDKAKEILSSLYRPFMLSKDRFIITDIPSAEMIKYAANSMLATRISFMNDIANLCEMTGADVSSVRRGIGADLRIGNRFLYPGCGYGGSCFPKDVKALVHTGKKAGYKMHVLEAVESVNERQKEVVFQKLSRYYKGDLNGKRIAMWGLAFKPETDDMREATSLVTIDLLKKAGCEIVVFDPVAMDECKRRIGDSVIYADDMYSALQRADALLLLTEWKQFRIPDWSRVKNEMANSLIVDGRNIYEIKDMMQWGFDYLSIGRTDKFYASSAKNI